MIKRVLSQGFALVLTAEVIGFILVMTALRAFTHGVSASLENNNASRSVYFFWISVIAVLIAMGLSKLKAHGLRASLLMLFVGAAGVWILGARLAQPLLDLGKALAAVAPQVIPALRSNIPMDLSGTADAWRLVAETSGALGLRVQAWLISLNQSKPLDDVLVRDMVWTLIIWLMASWTGWFAARRKAILALLPAMALLAILTSYSEAMIYTLWIMVSVLLLLMGDWNYKEHTRQWDRKKVDYSDSIRYDLSQAVIFLTIVIGAVTFVTPSISWREIRDTLRDWNKPSRNEVADVLGVQKRPATAAKASSTQQPSLPREHLLTGGFLNSQEVVMRISTGELPPIPNVEFASSAPRYYWRSVTYDVYTGGGWLSSFVAPQRIQPNTPLIQGLPHGYKTLHLKVELEQPQDQLYWSGMLFSADVPFTADWRIRPRTDLFAGQTDLLETDMFAALTDQTSYRVVSYVPQVTIDKLRAASTEYPEEIAKRYLGLPASVPERVRKLAIDVTNGQTNPYDKAKAIETYLRGYPYDLHVPGPPPKHDVADFFLFDLRRGYCDYYATAMVVLARLNGLPARFVSGYAPGSYDAPSAQYVVRELDAHSWPEIYFPEIGWVEFEPTSSQAEIVRYSSSPSVVSTPDPEAARLLRRFKFGQITYWFSPVAVILLVLLLQYAVVERWWYLHLAPATAIERLYRRLYRMGRPLAGERSHAETAYEFMQKLSHGVESLRVKEASRLARVFSGTRQDVEVMTGLYHDTLFSHHTMQKSQARQALNTWRRLRLRLLLAKVNLRLQKKRKASSEQ